MHFPKYMFIAMVVVSSVFSSCGLIVYTASKKAFTVEKGAIPPDFGTEDTYLIIAKGGPDYNKKMESIVSKKYHGKVIFEFANALKRKQYADSTVYRYCFDTGDGTVTADYTTKKFHIYDRMERKTYFSKFSSSWWGMMARAYIGNLEKQRLARQTGS